jgi:alpha-D-xyloside xylohydrolase
MIRIIILLLMAWTISESCVAQSFQRTETGVKTIVNNINIEVQFYGAGMVRIIKWPVGKSFSKQSLAIVKEPASQSYNVSEKKQELFLKTIGLTVVLDKPTGRVRFESNNGAELMKEGDASFADFNDNGEATYKVTQSFTLDPEEAIYGLGILQNEKMSQRNLEIRMVQNNTWDFVTFFQSVKGYGLYWDNYSPTKFTDNDKGTSFESEVGDGIDYYFIYGKNADGVIAGMRDLTGQVPMFPLWAYGFWQSKERYKSQEEIVDVVKKYRQLGVPLDGIIQDWQYWGNNYQWNAMEFVSPDFPDARRMVKDIHDLNAHLAVSIWSSFGPMTKPYREMDKGGMLFNFKTWPESGRDLWPPDKSYPSGVRVYDAYNPKARDIYWEYLNKGIFSLGVDAWWMDSSEPDHLSPEPDDLNTKTFLGSFRKVRNAYPLMTVGGVYAHQREVTSGKRVFILTRSGFAGQQRFGSNVWSGDVSSSWESLRNQVPAGLNFSLTGNPNFNSDIGGFFAGAYNNAGNGSGAKNPQFQELYVRWLQYAAFTPMMRSHGTDVPREIYNFGQKGEPVYDALHAFIKLRYSLLPYIYSTSWDVTKNQSSFMRALVMDFATDKKVWNLNSQYLFGKSFLVAPVLSAQYTPEKIIKTNEQNGWEKNRQGNKDSQRGNVNFSEAKRIKVYLPAGTQWYDFWTNEKHEGGKEIEKQTTLDIMPLYVRAGSIIPFGPDVQFAQEKKWDNLSIKLYPGADGAFVLYEDEFDNYNYENGQYTEIPFSWNEKSKALTIGERKGAYHGMLQSRHFIFRLPDGTQKTVAYTGKKINIRLRN